jgi:hypothetical protein
MPILRLSMTESVDKVLLSCIIPAANTMIAAITVTLIAIRVSMVIPFSIRLFFLP